MNWLQVINIIAIVSSPIVAIGIGEVLRRRSFAKEKRLDALHSLVAYRHKVSDDHFLSALNSLILLYKDQKLKELLFELRKAYENQENTDGKIVQVIKRVCELERFVNVSENDIENLFKAK